MHAARTGRSRGVKSRNLRLEFEASGFILWKRGVGFFTLSAGDEEEHLRNLQKIVQICRDDERVKEIKEAKNDEELSALIGG